MAQFNASKVPRRQHGYSVVMTRLGTAYCLNPSYVSKADHEYETKLLGTILQSKIYPLVELLKYCTSRWMLRARAPSRRSASQWGPSSVCSSFSSSALSWRSFLASSAVATTAPRDERLVRQNTAAPHRICVSARRALMKECRASIGAR